jgi:hypothetical protein
MVVIAHALLDLNDGWSPHVIFSEPSWLRPHLLAMGYIEDPAAYLPPWCSEARITEAGRRWLDRHGLLQ